MNCQTEATNDTPVLRRREVLKVTGLERGRVQGWEQQEFWTWPGEASTEKRLYSFSDTLRFALAAEMELCGIPIRRAWEFIREHPGLVRPGAVPVLVYCEVYRHEVGGQLIWKNCATHVEAHEFLRGCLAALTDRHVRGVRSSVVKVENVLDVTVNRILSLGHELTALSDRELLANKARDEGETQ